MHIILDQGFFSFLREDPIFFLLKLHLGKYTGIHKKIYLFYQDLSAYKIACLIALCPSHKKKLWGKTLECDAGAHANTNAHINTDTTVTTIASYDFVQLRKNDRKP